MEFTHNLGFSALIMIIQLVYLLIIGFLIFFMVRVLIFMHRKNKHDESLNNKLDQLIELLNKNNEKNNTPS